MELINTIYNNTWVLLVTAILEPLLHISCHACVLWIKFVDFIIAFQILAQQFPLILEVAPFTVPIFCLFVCFTDFYLYKSKNSLEIWIQIATGQLAVCAAKPKFQWKKKKKTYVVLTLLSMEVFYQDNNWCAIVSNPRKYLK